MKNIIEINNGNFEKEVKESSIPVMVDIYAQWCGPCKMLSPILDNISKEYDNLKICKADMEENDNLVSIYEINSVPTFLFFKDGQMINKIVGFCGKDKLDKVIKEILC